MARNGNSNNFYLPVDRRTGDPYTYPLRSVTPVTGAEGRRRDFTRVTNQPVTVGVAGATGYSGQELVRLLARHPRVDLVTAMAGRSADGVQRLTRLAGLWDGDVEPFDAARLSTAAVVFLALPEDASASVAPQLLERGCRVFDLSGSYRLRDAASRARWYHAVTALPTGTAYGMPERTRACLASARLVACAGCYPTAAVLALAPLVAADLVAGDIVIDAKSGVSGAGRKPTERTHFSEAHGSVSAYGVFAHRHAAEIEQELGRPVTFVPHLLPLDRGLLETIYVRVAAGTTTSTIDRVFGDAYQGEPFMRLRGRDLPSIRQVAHTAFCDIGWVLDEATGRLVVVSALDNLLKGAASQAVQSFNAAFGWDERLGLLP
jgi:N-acetyl-gamma-glutamyl-phosphate reductase